MVPETRVRGSAPPRPRGERALRVLLVVGSVLLAAAAALDLSAPLAAASLAGFVAAVLPFPIARVVLACAAGATLVALDLPALAKRSGAAERIALGHLGLVVAAAGLLRVAWRPSRLASRVAVAGLAAVLLYVLLPSGAGLLVAPARFGIADFELRVLTIAEWLLLPVAAMGVVAALGRRQGDSAFLAALLVAWYPAYLAVDLAFELERASDLAARLDDVRAIAAALCARTWLAAGVAALTIPPRTVTV